MDHSWLSLGVAAGVGDFSLDPPRLAGGSFFGGVFGTSAADAVRRGVSLELLRSRGLYLPGEGLRS